MTFSEFPTLETALEKLQIIGQERSFVAPLPHTVPEWFVQRLELVCQLGYVKSEAEVAQGLIFPILLEVWNYYRDLLKIWAEAGLAAEGLSGNPDYVVVRTAVPGQIRFAPPYAVIVEAKQEKLDEGWGQCLAAMVAAQRLNQHHDLAIYGMVTTGRLWEFGRLTAQTFLQDPQTFSLSDLPRLCGAVRYVFDEVSKYPAPPPLGIPQAA
jgi:hypothetical protein